ncbi:hypothetical protein CSW60_04260 [Caulobacter sp. X]|nr:hypothetical protein CSW60_04260 [Caulobacter sp. X]
MGSDPDRPSPAYALTATSGRVRRLFPSRRKGPYPPCVVQLLKGGDPVSHCLQPRSQVVTWSLKNEVSA